MISVEQGSYTDYSADVLICRKNGAIFKEIAPLLQFLEYIDVSWAARKGGHARKVALYQSSHPNYKFVMAVAYNPQHDNPDAFATNASPHGCNILQILDNATSHLLTKKEIRSIVLTSLSYRNPSLLDHVTASFMAEFQFYENNWKASLLAITLSSRPNILQLYKAGYSIRTDYLNKLEKHFRKSL